MFRLVRVLLLILTPIFASPTCPHVQLDNASSHHHRDHGANDGDEDGNFDVNKTGTSKGGFGSSSTSVQNQTKRQVKKGTKDSSDINAGNDANKVCMSVMISWIRPCLSIGGVLLSKMDSLGLVLACVSDVIFMYI